MNKRVRKRYEYALISFLPMMLMTLPGMYYLGKFGILDMPPLRSPWMSHFMPFILLFCIISIVLLYRAIFKELREDYKDSGQKLSNQ